MNAIISYISHSFILLTLGAALGSILLVGFLKSCSYFGLMPVGEDAERWHQLLKRLE
jgi:hypothetical protein